MRSTLVVLATAAFVLLCAGAAGLAVELKAGDIANPKGDGPDGKGNTADDTWQFWYQHDQRTGYGLMKEYKNSPTGVPEGKNVEGWVYSNTPSVSRRGRRSAAADWSPEFEGIWGNTKSGAMHAHPYSHHGLHASVAITYKVPEDGIYNISGTITDVAVVKKAPQDGVLCVVEAVTDGTAAMGRELGRVGPIGDTQEKAAGSFHIEKASLRKGERVRFAIDPNKWWGTDMTRLESFKIEPAK